MRGKRVFGLVAIALIASTGCTRKYYRDSADVEASRLEAEKQRDPRWILPTLEVYGDPRARFFDVYNPDRPPMPPDDPSAHLFMHRVYHMHGFHWWHHDGDLTSVTNPLWQALLPTTAEFTPEGKLKLNLPTAVLLARIHSPDYQRNIEEIYLSALDVAFERFRFDVQFFFTNVTTEFTQGDLPAPVLGATGPGFANSQTITSTQTNAVWRKHFAQGGDLLVNVANSMVWQFAGPNTNFATSIISGSFVQPLLRNGGKVLGLEQLTRVERTLLANVRAQQQYRQQFFRNLAVGGGTDIQPQRIGGFQGGAGLSGFTGIGVGGFGGVGASLNFGGLSGGGGVGASGAGAGAGFAGGGEGLIAGFYGLCQRLQTIRNTEATIAAELQSLGLLEATFSAGLIELVQVDEFRQNIETERAVLLRNQVAFRDNLEFYMINTIGLPPWLPVELDDSLIRPFQFIDPALARMQTQTANLQTAIGALPDRPSAEEVRAIKRELDKVAGELPARFQIVKNEIADLEAQKKIVPQGPAGVERKQFVTSVEEIRKTVEDLESRLRESIAEAEDLESRLGTREGRDSANLLVNILRKFASQLQELALLEAGIRIDRVVIEPIHLDPETAFWIARNNRLDWMNRRASLVDQWRLIWFNANKLMAGLDFKINGDLGTNGDNPARLRSPTGSLQGQLLFDAPITRKSERNLYRQSLIDYQRVRRNYIEYVDQVNLQIRARLRLLTRLHENLEIQRRALAIAIRRVDQTLEDLNKPFAPTQPGQAPQQLSPTLAQNLLRALSDFRNTQDNFLSVWMNYEAARLNLFIDLGLMQLTDGDMWVSESVDEAVARALAECPLPPPAVPTECVANEFLAGLDTLDAFGGEFRGKVQLANCKRRCWSPTPFLDDDLEQWLVETETMEAPGVPWFDLARQAAYYETDVQFPYPSPKTRFRDGRFFAQWTYWWYNWWELQSYQRQKRRGRPPMTREEFAQHLPEVAELARAGADPAAIAKKTGLDVAVVQAYLHSLASGQQPVIATIPTRPVAIDPGPDSLEPPRTQAGRDAKPSTPLR